jgi:hypothetical protein
MFERSEFSLPSHYRVQKAIDFKTNKGQFVILNLFSFVLLLPFIVPIVLGWIDRPAIESNLLLILWGSLGIFIVIIIIHELIHGYVYSKGTTQKVKYKFHGFAASAGVPGVYFYKKHYLLVGLAPALIINPILLLFVFILKDQWQLIAYLILILHFTGCAGDFYVAWILRNMPKETLIEDYGIGMRAFVPTTIERIE